MHSNICETRAVYRTLRQTDTEETTVNGTDKLPTLVETHSGGTDGKLTHRIIIAYDKSREGNKQNQDGEKYWLPIQGLKIIYKTSLAGRDSGGMGQERERRDTSVYQQRYKGSHSLSLGSLT